MKLKQRFVIGYYSAKLKTLAAVSPRKAAESAFKLFCTPYSGKLKLKAPAIFHKAQKINFELNGIKVHGFYWPANPSTGKTILICHGFDSSSYRFDKYVQLLLNIGFHVLAFDAPGHGISDGKTIHSLLYRDTILKIENLYGPVYGVLSHSLGALAASFAMEQWNDAAKKIVLIAPATEASTAIDNFFKFITVNDKTRQAFEDIINETGGNPVSWFSVTRAVQTFSSSVLWIHDEDDLVCPFADTKTIREKKLPHIQFLITKGLGHSKIYRDKKVQKAVVDFFSS